MNSIFSFKRFINYLGYDLVKSRNYFGISLLICGLMPVVTYLVYQLFSLVFTGSAGDSGIFPQIMAVFISSIVVVLTFPAKVYGSITERRAGSYQVLLPVSVFEKWLSMLVVTCLVLPICFGVLFFGVDALMSLCINGYPSPAFRYVSDFKQMLSELSQEALIMDMHLDYGGLFFIGWCDSILVYVLGAVFFKKSKIAKTILVLFALGMIASVFLGTWIQGGHDFSVTSNMSLEAINSRLDRINAFSYGYYITIFVVVNVLIYLRLKTIKH